MACCRDSPGAVWSMYDQILKRLSEASRSTIQPLGRKLLGRQHVRCELCNTVERIWVIDYVFDYDLDQLEIGFPCPHCECNGNAGWETSVGISYDNGDNSQQVVRKIWKYTNQTGSVKVVHPWSTGKGTQLYSYDGSGNPHIESYY